MATKGEIPDDGHGPNPNKSCCTATNRKEGGRCRNPAVPGLEICQIHIYENIKEREQAAEPETQSADTVTEPDESDIPIWERQREQLLGARR